MRFSHIRKASQTAKGFTLVEEMIAMGLVAMLSFSFLSSIGFVKTQRFRDREAGIATDFLVQYVEHLKGAPMDEVTAGRPLNTLYDGSGGSPLVSIPVSGQWVSLATDNYQLFHPDLVWLGNRQPQLRVTTTETQSGGVVQSRHVRVEIRWQQPLSERFLTQRMDLVRVRDV